MKPDRRLVLRREALHALDSGELAGVVGATDLATDCGCMTIMCLWSVNVCTSLPLNSCRVCW